MYVLSAHDNRSGLGKDLTLAALKRGDKVIATARGRSFNKITDLKAQGADILELDVGAPTSVAFATRDALQLREPEEAGSTLR